MVGMRDVAKLAGVSLSTVSLVVNSNGYVSDQMRARVEEAMRELNYIPNELARNLYHNRTNLIGVIVPTIRHPFFATLTAQVQQELSSRGYRAMLCSTADTAAGEAEYVDMLRRHMMDGIIMGAHTAHDPDYWTSIHRPIVAFDRYLGNGIASIGSDHEQGGHLVAQMLIRSGAKHVVMVGGPREQFYDRAVATMNLDGSTQQNVTTFPTVRYYMTLEHDLKQAGVRYEYVAAGEVSNEDGYAKAMHWVCERIADGALGGENVDAIVSSDVGAAYAVQEALRLGLYIPEQLQIVAYDGTYLTRTAGVRLTAVQQNFEQLAKLLVSSVDSSIRAEQGGRDTSGENGAGSVGLANDAGVAESADGNSTTRGAHAADVASLSSSAASEDVMGASIESHTGDVSFENTQKSNANRSRHESTSIQTLMDVLVPVTLLEGETTRPA